MKKKMFKRALKFVAMVVCLFVTASFFSGCVFGKTDTSFSVSGYVFDELGVPVEGVKISSELGEVLTDETGKYTISGIFDSIVVRPSIEGYYFDETSKLVSSKNDDANFIASKEYTIRGNVHSNNISVPNAKVLINSLSGNYETITDENGEFLVNGVAGKAVINCEKDSIKFFEVETTIENPDVSINSTSTFELNILADDKLSNYSKINMFVDGVKVPIISNKIVLSEIYCGQVIELSSDEYKLNKTKIIVDKINQIEEVFANKIYSVSGKVQSGNVSLSNASVLVNGEIFTTTDQNGWFNIAGLVSNNQISIKYQNFNFNQESIDNSIGSELEFNGTKNVSVSVLFDKFVSDDISFNFSGAQKINNYEYKLNSVTLGTEVDISSNDYFVEGDNFVIDDKDVYNINLYAYYDANVKIQGNINASLYLDEKQIEESELLNLYGTHKVSASYENYVFSEQILSYDNFEVTLTYQIPYSVSIKTMSGDVYLTNSYVQTQDSKYFADSNGVILIENLIGQNELLVKNDFYNDFKLTVNSECEKDINLTYNIYGIVKTGNNVVSNAKILVGESEVQTNSNGEFVLYDLVGKNQLIVEKDYYNFDNIEVLHNDNIEINGTYQIVGTISNGEEFLSNRTVNLIETNTLEVFPVSTNEFGEFEFNNLTGTYFLITVDENGEANLKPEFYTISSGGRYDFSLSGFAISGRVTSGDLPVENAYVVAGSSSTYTDADGYYKFELLTNECTVSVSKQGYSFSESILVSEDNAEVNFTATYSVSGVISSGNFFVQDVEIYSGEILLGKTNNSGEFEISNLAGNVLLTFKKQGYVFENDVKVSSPTSIEVSCKATKVVEVVSGDIKIVDFEYYINDELQGVSAESFVNIAVSVGDRVTFKKQGYEFDEILIGEGDSYTSNATYSVKGKILSGDVEIAGATIKVNGKTISTNSLGEFSLSDISGKTIITIQKDGYNAKEYVLTGFDDDLIVQLSYNISGRVYVGEKVLENVVVSCGELIATTNQNGEFEFREVIGKFNLTFEKEGYTFDELNNLFGTQEIVVKAMYSISGKVISGDNIVAGADVEVISSELSSSIFAKTNEKGEFLVAGIKGTAQIIVTKDGYSIATISGFTDVSNNNVLELTYSVTLNFNASGVAIFINGEKYLITDSNSITIPNLTGTNTLKFEKKNSSFIPNNFKVSEPGTFSISATFAYDIDGYIKTDSGLPVPNVGVTAGSSEIIYTDENGYFKFSGVAGTLTIDEGGVLSQTKQITADGTYNFEVSNYNFAYFLYENAYKNLDNAASFQIIGNGSVSPSMGGGQSVLSVLKKDNNGNRIKLNLNYGNTVLGVDPKVSLLAYFNAASSTWYYEQTKSVNSNLTANHSSSALLSNPVSIADYQSRYGARPDAYLPYNFSNKSGINSISNISVNGSGNYTFTISLQTGSAVYSMYATQIGTLSGQTVDSFEYINLNYEIDKNGWIVNLNISEKYKVKLMGVTITSNITYRFTTQSPNIRIDNIDVSSDSAIQNSLKESSQTEIIENLSNLDVVNSLIYGN